MPSLPTTWQMLPEWLLEPVMNQHLTLQQASQMWDEHLLTPDNSSRPLPSSLWPTAQTLFLIEMEPPTETVH